MYVFFVSLMQKGNILAFFCKPHSVLFPIPNYCIMYLIIVVVAQPPFILRLISDASGHKAT